MHPILVVDDHAINSDVCLLQLRALGWDGFSVSSGPEALEAVRIQEFTAILMDVMMPDMDGYETAREIRKIEQSTGRRRTPIIAVSAWAAQDNKDQCMKAGMDDYLAKPYTRDDLKEVLDRWISNVAK